VSFVGSTPTRKSQTKDAPHLSLSDRVDSLVPHICAVFADVGDGLKLYPPRRRLSHNNAAVNPIMTTVVVHATQLKNREFT
jgi:hypothetical protein